MKKILLCAFFAAASIILSGCGERIIVNGVSYRIMTKEEEKEMLSIARGALLNSDKKLTQAEKNFILSTEPAIKISYNGDKHGKASYEWICNDRVMLRVNFEGPLASSGMSVNTRKINLQEDIKKGQKSNIEKLTFKEIKP